MQDCTYFLYDSCKAKHPYVITEPSISRAADRLNTVLARLDAYPKEYREDVLELRDTLDILAYEQAHYAFKPGLDLGLSTARSFEEF